MHDAVCRYPRILLPRRWVNKGMKTGRSCYAPALDSSFSSGYYLTNLKSATCSVPSSSLTTSSRHVLAHPLLVFHT
jgi:hypothetical protein